MVPWDPWPDDPDPIDPPPPWLDLDPVVTIMLGGATAALHDAFTYPPEDLDEADRAVDGWSSAARDTGRRSRENAWPPTWSR